MHPYVDLSFARIGTFPLCVGLGLLVLVLVVMHGGCRVGLTSSQMNERLLPALPCCLLFGVCFAGFTDTLFHEGFCVAVRHPFRCGVNYFGWLSGCLLFLIVYGRWAKLDVRSLVNLFVPACLPAQACGRVGCFLGGCCFGVPTAHCGVTYPVGSPPWKAYGAVPIAPIQLYEAIWLLLAFVVVMRLIRPVHRGGVSLVICSVGRIAFELFRGDARGTLCAGLPITPAQGFGLLFVAVGILLCCSRGWNRLRMRQLQRFFEIDFDKGKEWSLWNISKNSVRKA